MLTGKNSCNNSIFFTVEAWIVVVFLINAILLVTVGVIIVVNITYYRYRYRYRNKKKIQTPQVAVYDEIEPQVDPQTRENSAYGQFQHLTDDLRTEISQNEVTQSSMETSRNIAYGHIDILVVHDTVQSN